MARGLVAQAHFDAIDAVDGGVAGRGAAEDFDGGAGQETEVREVVGDLLGQIDALDDAGIADLCSRWGAVTAVAVLLNPCRLAFGGEFAAPIRYTTDLVNIISD